MSAGRKYLESSGTVYFGLAIFEIANRATSSPESLEILSSVKLVAAE